MQRMNRDFKLPVFITDNQIYLFLLRYIVLISVSNYE